MGTYFQQGCIQDFSEGGAQGQALYEKCVCVWGQSTSGPIYEKWGGGETKNIPSLRAVKFLTSNAARTERPNLLSRAFVYIQLN